MRQQLLKILKYSKSHYELLVFDLYYCWCIEHSYSLNHLQKLVSSQKLFNWFLREYQRQEQQFLEYTKDYQTSNTQELRKVYNSMTCTINFYPKAILNEIRKTVKKTTVIGAHPAIRPNFN
ncbi:hypothetical protein TMP445_80049 [Tenacibaculum maritimum]|nr:hypothetical protein TMP445_80049 [Tenacibaculum maritimum]